MAFICYVVVASRNSCSLVFCSKAVYRLALVHSKYIRNREIVVIRALQRKKLPLLSLTRQHSRNVALLIMTLSNLSCSEVLKKFARESPWILLLLLALSTGVSKRTSPAGVFM